MPSKKYPRSEMQRQEGKRLSGGAGYVSWDKSVNVETLADFNRVASKYTGVAHNLDSAKAASSIFTTDFSDVDNFKSGRRGLTVDAYEEFRPSERIPTRRRDILLQCDNIYYRVGLIRNIIDLMGDFACQGIRLSHPVKAHQNIYRNWFKSIGGKQFSERFLNTLYRLSNVPVRRRTGKLKRAQLLKLRKALAAPDMKVPEMERLQRMEVPTQYNIFHPATISCVSEQVSSLVGRSLYQFDIPWSMRNIILSPRTQYERDIVSQLPSDLIHACKNNSKYVLPPEKFDMYFYKKDDWRGWGIPMIYGIMDSIFMLEKLKLADLAALDGAISNIRIFKLGSLEEKIMPNEAAFETLDEILQAHVGGGTIDIIWGPDIELIESKTSVHQFLGKEKYDYYLSSIYAALGIPPTLTGTLGSVAGTTNNLTSLKTLIQRLEYGRDILVQFWNKEIRMVQQALGLDKPAVVEFDRPNLSDEEAHKALLIQMADRELISDEMLQTAFNHDPELEQARIKRERKEREKNKRQPKAGPYHDPQFNLSLKKISLQRGYISPEQAGLELPETDEPTPYEMQLQSIRDRRNTGTGGGSGGNGREKESVDPTGNGRPKNSKDGPGIKRDRSFKSQGNINKPIIEIWAKAMLETLSEYLKPLFLEKYAVSNLRKLTPAQQKEIENVKFSVLCNLKFGEEITNEKVMAALKEDLDINVFNEYRTLCKDIEYQLNRKLTLDEIRSVQALVYVEVTQ